MLFSLQHLICFIFEEANGFFGQWTMKVLEVEIAEIKETLLNEHKESHC